MLKSYAVQRIKRTDPPLKSKIYSEVGKLNVLKCHLIRKFYIYIYNKNVGNNKKVDAITQVSITNNYICTCIYSILSHDRDETPNTNLSAGD